MRVTETKGVYEDLGVRRVINAMGSVTLLGGSRLSSRVRAAMEQANESFVDMEELLDQSGKALAAMLGAEAALVTSGAFAALVQGAAAMMTGKDPQHIARLPDTTGLRCEFLIQAATRYNYDRAVTVPGATLIEVGDARSTGGDALERAIGPRTAGVLHLLRAEGTEGVLTLSEVVGVARAHDLAVLVDAAAVVYPLDRMTWVAGKSGADLVCFGAKYFGAPHSTGVLCGRKDLVEAAALNGFIAFETRSNRSLGRGFKVDRQEIVGTVAALRDWFAADHRARFATQERRLQTVARVLEGMPHVQTEMIWPQQGPWFQLRVVLDEEKLGRSAAAVCEALRAGDPSIRVRLEGREILVAAHNLHEGEDQVVAERLRAELS